MHRREPDLIFRNEARREGERTLSDGIKVDHILVEELASPGKDARCGVNLICRPRVTIMEQVQAVQGYLRCFEPGQYYYPSSDLHLTLLEITHSQSPEEASLLASIVRSHIDRLMEDLTIPELRSDVLVFDPSASALSFLPADDRLRTVRQSLRERLASLGIAAAPRYLSESAHLTFMRYIRPLDCRLQDWVYKLSSAPAPTGISWLLSEVWLTWGANWYGMRSRISEAGPYSLGRDSDSH
jgi:hypothetical protein